MSLLNFLREKHKLFSVKEGCGVGDCGACTVVLAHPDANGKLSYSAVNSCLMPLTMVHGAHVITTEHLESKDHLHPLQQAFIDHHASQCGFCTPGLIMASLPLYKRGAKLTQAELKPQLAGNLCRCTGYKPILEAVSTSLNNCVEDHLDGAEAEISSALAEIIRQQKSFSIKYHDRWFHKVFSAEEALLLKAKHPEALVLSGATDLYLFEKERKENEQDILDISAVASWKKISDVGSSIVIGSLATLESVLQELSATHPALCDMLQRFASVQIRNLATLGGNICNASPIGDSLPILMALGTHVKLESTQAEREVALTDFIVGYRKTAIHKDELLTGIILPKRTPDDVFVKSYKVSKRPDVDISTVSAGMYLKMNPEGTVADIRLVYGGMAAMVVSARKTEEFLKGQKWEETSITAAMDILQDEFEPISDVRADMHTRQILGANLLMKFYLDSQQTLLERKIRKCHD